MTNNLHGWTILSKAAIDMESLRRRVSSIGPAVELYTDMATLTQPAAGLRAIIQAAQAQPLVLHVPNVITVRDRRYLVGIGHHDSAREQASLAIIRQALTLAANLAMTPAMRVVVHPATFISADTYERWGVAASQLRKKSAGNLARSLDTLLNDASRLSLTICLENMPPLVCRPTERNPLAYYNFIFPQEFNNLLAAWKTPLLTVCFDTCHWEMTRRAYHLFSRFGRGLGCYDADVIAPNLAFDWADYGAALSSVGLIHLAGATQLGLDPATHGRPLITAGEIAPACALLHALADRNPRPLVTLEIYERNHHVSCDNTLATLRQLNTCL